MQTAKETPTVRQETVTRILASPLFSSRMNGAQQRRRARNNAYKHANPGKTGVTDCSQTVIPDR